MMKEKATTNPAPKPTPSTKPETWQDRLKTEQTALADKIANLTVFVNDPPKDTDPIDIDLLTRQLDYMRRYNAILTQRLNRL